MKKDLKRKYNDSNMTETYTCEVCNASFTCYQVYYKHTRLKKNTCLSKERVNELLYLERSHKETIEQLETENKILKLEKENLILRKMMKTPDL